MTRLSRLMMAVLALFLASCAEVPPTEVERSPFDHMSTRAGEAAVLGDLARVAHAAALALRDPDVRLHVYDDMHASRDREKKLSLRGYLEGPGLILRQSMRISANLTDDQISSALRNLPPVDLYMPVPEHRATWSGDEHVIVAYQLRDGDIPRGYDLEGREVMLSLSNPPSVPTLVVVPEEAPTAPLNMVLENIKCDDPGAPDCDPPPPPPPPLPDGLYIDRMRIRHNGESWPRGEPELEVHVTGTQHGIYWILGNQPSPGDCPTYPNPITPGDDVFPCSSIPVGSQWLIFDENASQSTWVACSGEEAYGARDFNFDLEKTYEDDVLLAEASTFFIDERIRGATGGIVHRRVDGLEAPVTILVTERDDGSQCPNPTGKNELYDGFTVEWSGGIFLPSNQGFFEHLIHRILGNGNDDLAVFVVPSFTVLENASMLYMAGADVDIWLTNRGFDHSEIPTDEDPAPIIP